ncbi:MAG: GNAT family N-acetyltransferase [Arachnia sp.]
MRPATEADVELLRIWRNHPEVRRVSLTQHEISAEEHIAWWRNVSKDPSRRVLVYERDGVGSGQVTFFDIDGSCAWWGYYLDNAGLEARGALFPAWISIQREAVKYARHELGLSELHGETLVMNEAAVDFNQRLGFAEVERYVRKIGEAEVVVIHSRRTWEETTGE